MLWSIDTCQSKVSADQYHVTISRAEFTAHRGHVFFWRWPAEEVLFFFTGSWAHARLTCWKQGRIVRKPVNNGPGLKFISIITFSFIQMFFAALLWVYGDYKTRNRKPNSKQKTSPQSYKTQINILRFPRIAQSGTEEPGQGTTLLGWPKSIYYQCKMFGKTATWPLLSLLSPLCKNLKGSIVGSAYGNFVFSSFEIWINDRKSIEELKTYWTYLWENSSSKIFYTCLYEEIFTQEKVNSF